MSENVHNATRYVANTTRALSHISINLLFADVRRLVTRAQFDAIIECLVAANLVRRQQGTLAWCAPTTAAS